MAGEQTLGARIFRNADIDLLRSCFSMPVLGTRAVNLPLVPGYAVTPYTSLEPTRAPIPYLSEAEFGTA